MRKYTLLLIVLFAVYRVITYQSGYQDRSENVIEETINREPHVGESYQVVNVKNIKILLPNDVDVSYGDKITIKGTLSDGVVKNPTVIDIKENRIVFSKEREEIIEFIKRTLPEPHSSLIAGVVLGSKSGIPEDFMTNIRNTGVAHVVVASGMNVSLVVSVVMGIMLLFLPRRKAILGVYLFIMLYISLSGFDPPIVRAAIMAGVTYMGQMFGRVVSTLRVLLFTIVIMIIIFPYWLMDIGFLLSFIATLSLVLFEKRVRKFIFFVPGVFKESLSTTLAAQIGVTPILYVTFGSIYILSPIVNVLVLWTIPLITILGMLASLLLYIVPTLAKLLLYMTYPLTLWFVEAVNIFAK